jgi:putative ABC transport system ATP-binding protein
MSLIVAKKVFKSYQTGKEETKVLKGLDLIAEKSEMIMIMGPSGCGKTTLLNILGGIDKPNKGELRVAGKEITKYDASSLNKYRRTDIGFIFQFYNLIPTLTALENVILGIEAVITDKKTQRARAEKYLKLVGLSDKKHNIPQELSAGEQQRVAIARALAKEPKLILADEPTGNLDEERGEKIMELMKRLQDEVGITFIIVSHNSSLKKYADRTLILRKGKLTPSS